MDKIIELIIKNFSSTLELIWNSMVFWRAITLFTALFIVVSWKFRWKIFSFLQNPQKIEYDKKIFSESDNLLTERQLWEFLEQLGADHSYYSDDRHRLTKWCYFFDEVGNNYVNTDLNKLCQGLKEDLINLLVYLAQHFFVFPNGQSGDNHRLCMHPNLNIDREGSGDALEQKRYSQLADQLSEHINKSEQSYTKYRKAIKTKLVL